MKPEPNAQKTSVFVRLNLEPKMLQVIREVK